MENGYLFFKGTELRGVGLMENVPCAVIGDGDYDFSVKVSKEEMDRMVVQEFRHEIFRIPRTNLGVFVIPETKSLEEVK